MKTYRFKFKHDVKMGLFGVGSWVIKAGTLATLTKPRTTGSFGAVGITEDGRQFAVSADDLEKVERPACCDLEAAA